MKTYFYPYQALYPRFSLTVFIQDGRVEGRALIFSSENSKIATNHWTTIDRRMLDSTKKDTPHPRAKEKPQQGGSVQFSHSVVSNSLRPHELQHARPPCPSPTPGVHSNSCPSSQWCHPAISSSIVPFSSCPQSLSESRSFPMSQLFAWGGQSTGVSV